MNANQEKPNTCGSCKHTDNDLGLVALHCGLLNKEMKDDEIDIDKVRSWEQCNFKPSRYEAR